MMPPSTLGHRFKRGPHAVRGKASSKADTFQDALAFAHRLALGRSTREDEARSSETPYDALIHRLNGEQPSPDIELDLDLEFDRDILDPGANANAIFSHTDPNPGFCSRRDQASHHSATDAFNKLRIEYDTNDNLLVFKVSRIQLHTVFASQISFRIAIVAY
ncbi:hypothetical protein Landi51_12864 [Colletotrichum acutatum]